jgi:tRNA 2-thiouridine synthesizing protein C
VKSDDPRRVLLMIRHSPYGSGLARASLDVALAAAAFEQPVSLLFMGEGVLQLLPDQDSTQIGRKNLSRALTSLPLYDIDSVYVDRAAADRYHLDLATAPLVVLPLDSRQIHQLMCQHDHLLGF